MQLLEAFPRPRAVTLAGAALLTLLAWGYLWYDSSTMTCAMMMMPNHQSFTFGDGVMLFVMWAVMMIAMMTPSVTPTVLLVGKVSPHPLHFLSGYLLAWTAFSLLAAAAQWGLHAAALMASSMTLTNPALNGGVLAAAGVFQWTPWKRACLARCQSPLQFLMTAWREGARGALAMGFRHGIYCLGCCWLLMLVLFSVGVMNLLWIAALSVLVLLEKLIPHRAVPHVTGVALLAAGAWVAWA